mmetsp:Transcript_2856/g.3122  ORF Transcript_2856/g.3122 Transcript_2856/m.3122 type:complete len:83 (-) Transcript_2856:34-282(-)
MHSFVDRICCIGEEIRDAFLPTAMMMMMMLELITFLRPHSGQFPVGKHGRGGRAPALVVSSQQRHHVLPTPKQLAEGDPFRW